jgi:calcium-dependent protein kinase
VHGPAQRVMLCLQEVTTLYTLGKVLGRGQFGVTRLATNKATGEELACKSISKRKLL